MCVLLFIEDLARKGIAFFIGGNLLLYHIFSGGIRVIIDQTQEKNAPVALGPLHAQSLVRMGMDFQIAGVDVCLDLVDALKAASGGGLAAFNL